MSCGTRAQGFRPGDPDGAWLLRSSLWDQSLTKRVLHTARWPAVAPPFGSQPVAVPRLLWLRTRCRASRCARPQPTPVTGVLLTDFAAARQFIPARPYCLSGLRQELYPCNRRMSMPATTDFPTLATEVIRPERRGKPPSREDPQGRRDRNGHRREQLLHRTCKRVTRAT